jgi:hypothetical protein
MQVMELNPTVVERGEIGRRIEGVRKVRALCGRLAPGRERHYEDVMAAANASGSVCKEAALALDLLSLELCDD